LRRLFWFNPLVWILGREAHQLREEAADDSVLGADIAETDYAQLLAVLLATSARLCSAHGVARRRIRLHAALHVSSMASRSVALWRAVRARRV
jgi:beta-lactamase regulating signal transducer with metallopeptidase domain